MIPGEFNSVDYMRGSRFYLGERLGINTIKLARGMLSVGGDGIQSSTLKNSPRILISLFCILNQNNLTKKYSA